MLVYNIGMLYFQYFLAVANLGESDTPTNSTIFKWSKKMKLFIFHQSIATVEARALESFAIGHRTFLIIADNRTSYNKPFPGKETEIIVIKRPCIYN